MEDPMRDSTAEILSSLKRTATQKLRGKLQRSGVEAGAKKKRAARHRNWCFTLNNYTEEDCNFLLRREPPCSYAVWGFETGDEKNTPHLQGYAEFEERLSLAALKELWGPRYSFAPRKGTQKEAIDYCTKDGCYQEVGNRKRQVCPHCHSGPWTYLDVTE